MMSGVGYRARWALGEGRKERQTDPGLLRDIKTVFLCDQDANRWFSCFRFDQQIYLLSPLVFSLSSTFRYFPNLSTSFIISLFHSLFPTFTLSRQLFFFFSSLFLSVLFLTSHFSCYPNEE